jgi:hypothetical protein
MTGDIGPRGRKSITKFRKNLATAERDAAACRMYYAERRTYRQIAAEPGFHDESGAKKAADRGLRAIQVKGNENLVAEVRARIAENREFVKGIRDNPPQKVSPTGAPVFGRDGEPVYDSQVSLQAAAELRKLDQPQSFKVSEVRLLIVQLPGFGCDVCLAVGAGRAVAPGVPGCAPAPTAPGGPPFVRLGRFVLVRRVLAGRRAAASR